MRVKFSRAMCSIFLADLLVLALASGVRAEGPIKQGSFLTLQECIRIALRTNPQAAAAGNTFIAAQSRIGQAKSGYYPQVDWQTDYTHFSSTAGGLTFGQGAFTRTTTSQNNFQTGPSLTQNIYDFGKTKSQVGIATYNSAASGQDFENVNLGIVLGVKTAYYGVLQAGKSLEAARKVVKQAQEHLVQAQGFFQVGTKPKIDVTNAEVTLSNAQLALIQAQNAVQIAWQNLNNAMGIPNAPEYRIEDTLAYEPYPITFEEALKRAYSDRPDLKAAIARVKSSEQSMRLAHTGYYPAISGSAGYTWNGDSLPLDHGWNVGATLTIPIFNGFLTRKQVDEANANLNVSRASEETLRQQIYLQNRQAFLNLKQSESSIATAATGLKQAQENLDLANGRYAAGVGSNIEVTDALTTFTSAQTAYINALYSYKTAEANLENAMGVK
ncbi:MAG: TolC family protein [Nitrospiraceae bacterium]|nr:TolC family protein [Nitrospiraceae bacterium]